MRQKLMSERISNAGETELSSADIALLKKKRDKQLIFLLSGYLPILGVILFVYLYGPAALPKGHVSGYNPMAKDQRTLFWEVIPYVTIIGASMATAYFIKLYFQSLRPLMKDIKNGKKKLYYFLATKNAMDIFNKYYISTPLYDNQQIEISREDFNTIYPTEELCLEVGPDSNYILRMMNGPNEINYY